MHEILVNRLGSLGLPRNSVIRLTDRPDMTLAVFHGRKTITTTLYMKTPHDFLHHFLFAFVLLTTPFQRRVFP